MKTRFALVLFAVACLFATACRTLSSSDATVSSSAGVKLLRFRWLKKLGTEYPNFLIPEMQEQYDRFKPVEFGSAAFDTDKRRAFVGAAVGGLYCLDMRRGETVWRFEIDDPVGSVPIHDGDRKRVYFGADDGKFYAIHARSGRLIWSIDLSAEVRKPAILQNNTLYVVSADNTVLALDPDNGQIVWQYRRPPLKGFSSAGYAGIVLAKGKLFTGFSDGYLVALDPAVGAELWSLDLASEIDSGAETGEVRLPDSDATPVVVGNVLVAASVDGGLQGVSVETGTVLWTNHKIVSVTGLAAYEGTVYAARSAFGLSAIQPKTGELLWNREFESGMLSDPVVYEDVLLISDAEYGLYAVSAIDGKLLQQLNAYEGFFARPSIHAGYLLIMGNGGTLYAMSIL